MKLLTIGLAVACLACAAVTHAAMPACDRACLAGAMEDFPHALVTHDPTRLSVTRNVKYTENGVRLNLGDGLWQTAAALPTYRLDLIDDEAEQVGLLGRISENGNNNWYAVRLKVEPDHKVFQIEILSISAGAAGPPGGAAGNTEPHPLMAEVIPADKRMGRADLARIGNSYFTGMADEKSGANVPFSPMCQRREKGSMTANDTTAPRGSIQSMDCKSRFDTGFSVIVTPVPFRMESGW